MRQRLLIALLVLVVLAAGFVAGYWVERQRPVPPPPAGLMAELVVPAHKLTPAQNLRMIKLQPAVNRAQLVAAIAEVKPQIKAYQEQMTAIEQAFEQSLQAVLTPAQQSAYAQAKQQLESARRDYAKVPPAPPLSTAQILALGDRPAFSVLNMVVLDLRLDWLTDQLQLTPEQQQTVRELLRQRRDKFLALVDATPPPSLMLSDLAEVAQRIVEPMQLPPPQSKAE